MNKKKIKAFTDALDLALDQIPEDFVHFVLVLGPPDKNGKGIVHWTSNTDDPKHASWVPKPITELIKLCKNVFP